MIAAKKPDENLRLCIDPHYLNLALKWSHYPRPLIEEIIPELSKAKIFSKLKLIWKKAFFQFELNEEYSTTDCLSDTLGALSLAQNAL